MFFHHGRVGGTQLGAGLVESGAGREAAEELGHAVDAAGDHGGGEMVRAGDDVGDDFRVGGIRDGRLEDADDGSETVADAAEAKRFADDRGIALEGGGPEAIGEDDHARGVGAVVLRADEAAEDGMQAHDAKVGAADDAGANFARLAEADHGETDGREVTKSADGVDGGFEILILGYGESGVFVSDALRGLADIDQTVFVAVDQRLEEDATDEGEYGGVGADAEGQREDHRDGQATRAREGMEGKSQVPKERHGSTPPALMDRSTPVATLKRHIIKHFVCDASAQENHFQDERFAKSDSGALVRSRGQTGRQAGRSRAGVLPFPVEPTTGHSAQMELVRNSAACGIRRPPGRPRGAGS